MKRLLVFGCGPLQLSIIERARAMGFFTIGIDPCPDAPAAASCDAFETVDGQDFERTCAVVEKYGIDGVVTASTDKPLRMMARVAERFGFPFVSERTAVMSTDKMLMKEAFEAAGVPCAKGRSVKSSAQTLDLELPIVIKPRDNSGSRGVVVCRSREEVAAAIEDALSFSHLDSVLAEEFIEGDEYSIESLHLGGKCTVLQFTEKHITPFPHTVELGHVQPAGISESLKEQIRQIVSRTGECLGFDNCPSHTEVKINSRGIFVIETSPRLGGDYITSHLVPLSTGVNMEEAVLSIAAGIKPELPALKDAASGISFFRLPQGRVLSIDGDAIEAAASAPDVMLFKLNLVPGSIVGAITSSLSRYGEVIVKGDSATAVKDRLEQINGIVADAVKIDPQT